MGIYIFNFRIGELIVGLNLLLTFLIFVELIINKKFDFLNKTYLILILTVFIYFVINPTSVFKLYSYRSSSYIWAISLFIIVKNYSTKFEITKNWIYIYQFALIYGYILSAVNYPEFLQLFFKQFSDKFDFVKASSLAIFFIVVTFLSNRLLEKKISILYFFFISSLFLPLFLVKSRGSFLAIVLFIFFELINLRGSLQKNKIKTLVLLLCSCLIFIISSFHISGQKFEISKTEQIGTVLTDLSETKNTSKEFLKFYIKDNRLFSSDYNVNWRIQIWQDVYFDLIDRSKLLVGYGYADKIPAMTIKGRQGIDGLNENVHNFLVNIFARGGLLQVFAYMTFVYNIFKQFAGHKFKNIITFIIPIFVISFFDSSMENAHFPVIFYLTLGYIFSNLNFKEKIK